MAELLVLDGSHGEGGGQILRTALALAALTGRSFRLEKIRAGRPKGGLAAQHLTAVQATAAISAAEVEGAVLGSQRLSFAPGPTRAGDYTFDVAAARQGGSAGATTLVLQAVLLPLALAAGRSRLILCGGTHMAWSPPFDDVAAAWLGALRRMGVEASVELVRWGFYPVGRGEITARIEGGGRRRLASLELLERGPLALVRGRAVGANLPAHVPERMARRARALLAAAGLPSAVEPLSVEAACPGAGVFLAADYAGWTAGFSALGARGKPAEAVAEEAVEALLGFHRSGATVDAHLADQLLLPCALAGAPSRFLAERATGHLTTNAWTLERFDLAAVSVTPRSDGTALVTVTPKPAA
jgi:RNA 3'-terminal phosphate cyclase (ATP)